ncbi:hypothetical protein RB653_004958 [Dictyostelium firmibasis]|uniref:Uncharacterized protein n=1 Tax=Dictyostelium firmibasis TaxID=79012 RepID=A0AAN7YXS2_9MYCE
MHQIIGHFNMNLSILKTGGEDDDVPTNSQPSLNSTQPSNVEFEPEISYTTFVQCGWCKCTYINKIMSTTDNNNHASSSTENNSNSYETRIKSLEDQISNLSLAFTRYMKEPIRESYGNSDNQRSNDESETENEQGDDESVDPVDVPTDYQLSESLLANYKHLINNQGLLVEEKCILKKNEIADVNKIFCFPSNFQVNVAPFGTPEGISASSNLKNNDTDLYIVEKRINDILKPILLLSSMISSDKTDIDTELLGYLADSSIQLVVSAQATLARVRRNNISKEIYGSEVVQPIKIKDTPKMFDDTESERVRKLAKFKFNFCKTYQIFDENSFKLN